MILNHLFSMSVSTLQDEAANLEKAYRQTLLLTNGILQVFGVS